jgi:hypothetical protein
MPRALLEKIFDYHFSSSNPSNDPSMLSYTDFENHLYDQLVTRDDKNRMSGYINKTFFLSLKKDLL